MPDLFLNILHQLTLLIVSPFQNGLFLVILKFVPFVVFLELPVYTFTVIGVLRYYLRKRTDDDQVPLFYPRVSCIVMGYSEGDDISRSILSLAEQIYPGVIEILVLIDGASKNKATLEGAKKTMARVNALDRRILRVIPKWQRGGRVSSLNAGLKLATGAVVLNIDGDTSFDNDMIAKVVPHFLDPGIMGVAGNLRVRNSRNNIHTRFQALEYMLSIQLTKIGLSEFNVLNNISGAFGVYRKSFLNKIGGWDSGTAEDLDLTMRSKHYFGRHPGLRLAFEPEAIGHTEVPSTMKSFLDQRLRWDGDLFYLYVRKHALSFSPRIMGWKNTIFILWTGLFFQVVMPMVILIYTFYMMIAYPVELALALMAMIYLLYLSILCILFTVYIILISERKRQDLALCPILLVAPVYTFILRIWGAIATLKEIFMRSHLDSSMAPWWVLNRTKF